MVPFRSRGWELVAADVTDTVMAALRPPRVTGVTRIGAGRYALQLPLDPPPERLLSELTAAGAQIVSLNPVRDTLEDFFVRQVEQVGTP